MDNNAYCTSKRTEVQIPKAHITGLVGSRVPVITVLDRARIGGFPCGLLAASLAPNLEESACREQTEGDRTPHPHRHSSLAFMHTHGFVYIHSHTQTGKKNLEHSLLKIGT